MKNASLHEYIGPRWLFGTERINYTTVMPDHSATLYLYGAYMEPSKHMEKDYIHIL